RLEVIRIGLKDAAGEEVNHFIRSDSPAILDPRRFKLLGDGKPIPFSPLLKNPENGLVSAIFLAPQKKLATTEGLTVEMTRPSGTDPGLILKDGTSLTKFGPIKLNGSSV